MQSYIYQVLQTIQMKLILLCVWAEPAVLGSAKTALKLIYKIQIGYYSYTIQCMGQFISFKSEINNPWFNPWFILLHTHSNVCATVEGRCLEYLVCITLPYVLWPFDHQHMVTPLPPKTCWRLKWMVPYVLVWVMTQLLLHTFAHLTGPSFRVKAKLLPNNFFLGLV